MRVRAVKSFIWDGRDVDVGEILESTPREAFLLVQGYGHCVYVDEAPASPTVMTTADPVPVHADPIVRRRR